MMPILTLDLGTHTGWSLRDTRGNVISGRQSFELTRWESHGMRQLRFRKWIREMLDEFLLADDPEQAFVAYERPIIAGRGKNQHRSGNEVGKLLVGTLLPELEERELLHAAPTPVQVKKHATGKGNANKHAMVEAAENRWEHYSRPKDYSEKNGDDEADALGIMGWAIDEVGASG